MDKMAVLIHEVGDLEDQYVDRYDQYRIALKAIRNIEKVVQPIRNSTSSDGLRPSIHSDT